MIADWVLALDPGDRHVGWAERVQGIGPICGEWTPAETIREIRARVSTAAREEFVMEIVIEEFALYPDKAKEQAGSQFQTSQLIGAIKLIAHDAGPIVRVVMQGATIKKPTRRQLRARGISLDTSKGGHAIDAQLHFWYRVLRNRGEGTG